MTSGASTRPRRSSAAQSSPEQEGAEPFPSPRAFGWGSGSCASQLCRGTRGSPGSGRWPDGHCCLGLLNNTLSTFILSPAVPRGPRAVLVALWPQPRCHLPRSCHSCQGGCTGCVGATPGDKIPSRRAPGPPFQLQLVPNLHAQEKAELLCSLQSWMCYSYN